METKFFLDKARMNSPNPKEIVFIHGMFMTPKSWQPWVEHFSSKGYVASAPAWPFHESSVEKQRAKESFAALGKLNLKDVIGYHRKLLQQKAKKPILVGHSMGGLVAQVLLSEGLASAAVGLHSAPPLGVFALSWSSLKSNWGAINPVADINAPIQMNLQQFSYAFTNAQGAGDQQRLYNEFYVPESRRVGKGPLTKAAKVDRRSARGPLLIVAGSADHIIPAKLNFKNFEFYKKTEGYTEYLECAGRDHSTAVSSGWEAVAQKIQTWIEARFQD